MKLYCSLVLCPGSECAGEVGDVEVVLVGAAESMVRYHSFRARVLTLTRYPGSGQYQVGSLTGAVAS